MGNELLVNGIAATLDKKWSIYPIYKEDIPPGFWRPCFYIRSLEPTHKAGLHFKAVRNYQFVIHFFPERGDNKGREHCRAVNDILYDILEYLPLSNGMLRRGYQMKGEITEDCVLQFHVRYELQYYMYSEHEKMHKLDIDLETKP